VKTVKIIIGTLLFGLLTACSTSESNSDTSTQATTEEQSQITSEESTADEEPEAEPVEEPNLGGAFNQAWIRLADAQKAYDGLSNSDTSSEVQSIDEWVGEADERLQLVRSAWREMKDEADALPLPDEFTTKGIASRGTTDQYINAYDQYLTMQEEFISSVSACVESGSDDSLEEFLCVTKAETDLTMDEENLEVYDRLQEATVAIFEEANQPTP